MASRVSARVSGAVAALRICTSVATVVFVGLAAASLLIPHQGHRLALLALFVVSAGVCGAMSRVADTVDEPQAEPLLLLLCLIPTVDALLGMAVLRDETVTDYLYLTFVAYGLLAMRWRTLAALVLGALGLWLAEALWLGFSHSAIGHDLVQLVLRSVLAFAVLKIRNRLDGALRETGEELEAQVAALAETRELHGRELSRFRTMFHDGPLGIMVMDMDGLVVDMNGAMEKLLRLSRESVVSRDIREFVPGDDRRSDEEVRAGFEAIQHVGTMSMERRYVRGDGTVIDGSVTATAISGPVGEPWILAHVEDVTQRKAMERDLIRSRDGLRAVADISSASQRGVDPRPVAVAHLERLAGANHVSLIEMRDEKTLVISASVQSHLRGVEIDLDGQSGTAHVWRTGEPLFLADAAASPLVNLNLIGMAGVTSVMWQPVGTPGNLSAVLSIGWPETVTGVTDVDRDAVRTLAAELSSALTAEQLRKQLEQRSQVDALTGLMNRRGWDHGVADLLKNSRRSGQPFVLAVADLDHFKQFNDEFGHLEGDILLSGFAAAARTSMRDVDLLARWGGEEFAIALRDCDLSDAQPVLERIRSAVPAGRTCSIGFATFNPNETIDACMRRADQALYRAKANGRDRIEYSHYDAPSGAPEPVTEGRIPERRRAH